MDTRESNVHREAEDILRQAGAERRAIGEAIQHPWRPRWPVMTPHPDKAIGICECEWHDEHEKAGDTVCPHCRGRIIPQGRSERGSIMPSTVLVLATIGVALVLAVLAGNVLLSARAAPSDTVPTPPPEHCGMTDRAEPPDCPTPSPTPSPTPTPVPVPCEDNEERLPDGTCRVVYPPECFPSKAKDVPWEGWPCTAPPERDHSLYPPPPDLFPGPSPTPISAPARGPADLPATGGEPGGQR